MINNKANFREELDKANEWWLFGEVKDIKEKKLLDREVLCDIKEDIDKRRIIIVTGPRRVGKTILLKQIVKELLVKNVNKYNILYYSLDDPSLFPYSDNLIKDIVDLFLEDISKEGRKYILLDEVHSFKDWYKWVKSYYDKYSDIKFVLSGSSSLVLQKEANYYLRGRTLSIEMFPLNFKEFLELSNIKIKDLIFNHTKKDDYFKLKRIYAKIEPLFKEYLSVGGFPEWFEVKDIGKWFSMLIEDVPKKAIYEDIANQFNLKNSKILETVLVFLVSNQSRILSYEKINEVAGLDRGTLINYVEYLKSSYLIIEILKYAKNVKEQLKSMKKYLTIDQGLRNALIKDFIINENNIGFIIENIVGLHLFRYAKKKDINLFYYREKDEVDFILNDKVLLPIEVKYSDNIRAKQIKALIRFMEDNKLRKGIVTTKSLLKEETINNRKIVFIPVWMFILSL